MMVLRVRAFLLFLFVNPAFSYLTDGLARKTQQLEEECATPALELLQRSVSRTKRAASSRPTKQTRAKTALDREEEDDGDEREVRDWDSSHVRDRGSDAWPGYPTPENVPASVNIRDYSPPRPIKVLGWTSAKDYMGNEDLEKFGLENCHIVSMPPVDDFIIRDRDYPIDDFDVIIFNLPALMLHYPDNYVLPRRKLPGQLWIGACGEPLRSLHELDCRLINDTQTRAIFDGFASFSSESEFPAIQDPLLEDALRLPPPNFVSYGPEIASLTMSDPVNPDRNTFVQYMYSALEERGQTVFSDGPWQHNAEEPNCTAKEEMGVQELGGGRRAWVNRCAARPFKIVSEQVWEDGYVTEKVWDALGEGSIPVYWGTKDVERWVPPGSILHVADFESYAALADRMVNFSDEDFAAARAWKSKPTSEWGGWAEAWRLSRTTLVPRLCEKAAQQFPSPRLHKYPRDAGIPSPEAHELPESLQLTKP